MDFESLIHLEERSVPLWSLSIVNHCSWRVGFSLVSLYLHLSYWSHWCSFNFFCGSFIHPFFQVPFSGNYFICSVDLLSVSVWGGEFRIFLHCHLEPSPKNQALFRCIACDHFADGLCHRQMSWEITKNRDSTCYLRWSEEVFANSRTALWPTFASLKKLQFCPCQISFHLFFVKPMPIYSWIVKCHCLWKTQLAEHLSIFLGQSEYLPPGEPSVTGHSPLWDSPWCCCHGFSNTQQASNPRL